ncbi:tetratricopeptide repeat-containing sensor histidine kinase [Flavobacterium wongokense]|uniref:tetratricopeptide repeat-containing sensor histidine kinase n=1 Tax=Flavobacterium wongokense TaxID=2910674 RepID=UPI001F296DC7|nr:ATP-binding protein [Flavobacterium sp. WG47]MCF6130770.1 ATP-binding protein [Flavobacterium sp. WG47]
MREKSPIFLCFLLFFLIGISSSYGQNESVRLKIFMDEFSRLESGQKFDSINLLTVRFSELENLTQYEKAGFYLYKSIYYKRISRYEEAIAISRQGLKYCDDTNSFQLFKKRLLINIADIYFTILKYDEANRYAVQAKKIGTDGYHDIDNYCITGYWFEINKKYSKSIAEYEQALHLIRQYGNICKSAQVLNKMAVVYCKEGNYKKGIILVDKAISLADSCQEMVNSINARKSKYDILRASKKYKEATELYDTIILLDGKYAFNLRNEKLDELEAKYQNELKTQKNASLSLINKKNNGVINRQRIILYCSISVIVIFLLLVFFLIKFYRKQRAANKELQRLNLLNQKIFSVISHDFKGPITTLKLMLSNDAVKENEDNAVGAYLKEIGLQLEQSDAMLESLLDWAKTELKIKAGKQNPYSIHALVSEVAGQLKSKLDEKELTVSISFDTKTQTDFPQEVLKIVFRNIMSNAIKFSNPKSVIEISYLDNKLKVRDYGKGIPKNKLDKLFNQAISPGLGTFHESGFGIGLYLSYELMQKNNGVITVENNEDVGCTFSIVLP